MPNAPPTVCSTPNCGGRRTNGICSRGCNITKKGVVLTNRFQQTNIEGLYVAGDAAKDMHLVVVAAAEGAKAGVIINKELQKELTRQPQEELLTS